MAELSLTEAQRAVIENRGGALLVSAAAGSGKTFVLVRRLMSMIEDPENPSNITDFLIITYTKAAASELRSKIMEELRRRLADNPANPHIKRQLTLVHAAKIMTVHSYCTALLKENAHLLELSPDFRIAEEAECDIMKTGALEAALEKHYSGVEADSDFAALVDNMSAGFNDTALEKAVLETYEKVRTHCDPWGWAEEQLNLLERAGKGETNPWADEIMSTCCDTADYWISRYSKTILAIAAEPVMAEKYLCAFEDDLRQLKIFREALSVGWEEAGAASHFEFSKLGTLRKYDDEDFKKQVQDTRKSFKDAVKSCFQSLLETKEVDIIQDCQKELPILRGLFALTKTFEEEYTKAKTRKVALDFGDLEHLAIKLLIDKNGQPTPTAIAAAAGFREVMVDEYQDTNEIQNRIITAVSKNGSNLFMVGDVKQSIYRFRLADPGIFLEKYNSLPDYTEAVEGQGRRILLSRNFRSRSEILEATNFVFENIMSTECGELDYGEAEKLIPGAEFSEGTDCSVELDIIDMEESPEEDADRVQAEAAFAARRIRELLKTYKVSDSVTGGQRALTPGDIVILMRSPGSRADTYMRELGKLGIPCGFGGGQSGLLDTAEAKLLISLLEVIDNPRQDIPLIALLKSPLFGFTADELAQIRIADMESSFYEALLKKAETDNKTAGFLTALSSLRGRAPYYTAEELIWQIFAETDIIPVCMAMDGGELRRKNLLLLCNYAKELENGGCRGLYGFVSRIRSLKERGENLSGASESSMGNAVTIMSIHKSKGLEFPVVLLCDLARQFNRDDLNKRVLMHRELGVGSKLRDSDRMIEYSSIMRTAIELRLKREMLSEEMRVLYVAMTRAKEKLIMTASFKKAQSELEKACSEAASPVDPQVLLQANSCGRWLLYAIMNRVEGRRLLGYDIGRKPGAGAWDIRLAAPTVEDGEVVSSEAEEKAPPINGLEDRLNFAYPYQKAENLPSKLTATYLKGRYLDEEAAEESQSLYETQKPQFKRPAFITKAGLTAAEKGTATHLVMQYIDFNSCTGLEAVKEQILELRRAQIITEAQYEAVKPKRIWSFFAGELGKRVMQAAEMKREFKFSLLVPAEKFIPGAGEDELMLQGVIDCFFEEDGELVLVDFKTDGIAPGGEKERAESYRLQMETYGYALERMTGKRVKEKVLFFFSTGRTAVV